MASGVSPGAVAQRAEQQREQELTPRGSDDATDVLVRTVSNDDVAEAVATAASRPNDERFDAQEAVLVLGPAAVDGLALLALGETSDSRRRIAIWALGELEDSAACAAVALLPAFEDGGTEFVSAFAKFRCDDPAPLRALLDADEVRVALKTAIALALEEDVESLPRIREMAESPTYATQRVFLDLALGLLGDVGTEETLQELRSTALTRPYAAIALFRIGDSAAAIDLRMVMSGHEDPVLRYHAMRELIDAHVEGTRSLLYDAGDDPSPRISRLASREARLWERRRPIEPAE
ncbi:MAG: hypothetical protein ACI81R_003300 [Bradymonadia bacterium]|jgi:hypothetical protein